MKSIILTFFLSILISSLTIHANNNDAPVTIFYGLNESHAHSWAACAPNGSVGISFFEVTNASNHQGDLKYKSISTSGEENTEIIDNGQHLEISVILFDQESVPHIFVANSENETQWITHYTKNGDNWENEIIITYSDTGKFLYELSADKAPDGSFHLLILQTRSNPDSDDYYWAFLDAQLHYLNNSSGNWEDENLFTFDMFYTMDEYSKTGNRQDIAIDTNGKAHIVYGKQINGSSNSSPTQLNYITNRSGNWESETAVKYADGSRDSAGWYPSIDTDSNNIPHISYCYVARVPTGSAKNAKLYHAKRAETNNWQSEIVADSNESYLGKDGIQTTGALSHLIIDNQDQPHIAFSDIASSHGPRNYFNVGNVRYASKIGENWIKKYVYQQSSPSDFFNATENYGQCMVISPQSGKVKFVFQELHVNTNSYSTQLLIKETDKITSTEKKISKAPEMIKVYPNPTVKDLHVDFLLAKHSTVYIRFFDIGGQQIKQIIKPDCPAGRNSILLDLSSYTDTKQTILCHIFTDNQHFEAQKISLLKTN